MKRTKLQLTKIIALLAIFLSFAANVKGDTFVAVVSGNWTSSATWGGTAPPTTVTTDTVVIPSDIMVTMDTDVEFNGTFTLLDVNGSLEGSANSLVMTKGTLGGSGNIDVKAITYGETAITLFTGELVCGNYINSKVDLLVKSTIEVKDTLYLMAGNLIMDTGGSLELQSESTVKVEAGDFSLEGGAFIGANAYSVIVVGEDSDLGVVVSGSGLTDLKVMLNSSSAEAKLQSDAMVNGTLTLEQGKLSLNGYDLMISGDIAASGSGTIKGDDESGIKVMTAATVSGELRFESGSEEVDTLEVDIDNEGHVKLDSDVSVKAYLNLQNGSCMLDGNHLMIEGDIAADVNGSIESDEDADITVNTGSSVSGELKFKSDAETVNNLTVNIGNEGHVELGSEVEVMGNLTLENGSLTLNSNHLMIKGDIAADVNGSIESDEDADITVNTDSSVSGELTFNSDGNTFDELTIDIGGDGYVKLGSEAYVSSELMLDEGKLSIQSNDLHIMANASISGQSENNFVMTSGEGSLMMNVDAGGSAVIYPVGTDLSYCPVTLAQASGAASGKFGVSAENNVYANGYGGGDISETEAVVDHTYYITSELSSNIELDAQLEWMSQAEVNGFDRTECYISHYMNGTWNVAASGAAQSTTRGTFALTAESLTSLSPFSVHSSQSLGLSDDPVADGSFKLYPNPVKGNRLNLELNDEVNSANVEIYNTKGELLISEEYADERTNRIDVSNLKPGVYFIKVFNEEIDHRKKFIK
ncbi:MAG: T9SS type A sorting domain-containing protein [Bacteroidales bacterium]|nr:T9SS type A sorting domain-containing protein [Bacteroidales bacterium]